jgi:hypothetical protein
MEEGGAREVPIAGGKLMGENVVREEIQIYKVTIKNLGVDTRYN